MNAKQRELRRWVWLGWLCLLSIAVNGYAFETCDICGERFEGTVFSRTDQVTGAVRHYCRRCSMLPTVCFLCGIPVANDFRTLPDGRIFCSRDGRTVVLDDNEAAGICEQVKADVGRQFVRFIAFPDTNVTSSLMDRVRIQEFFKFAGNDFSCPNMWGCTETRTNGGQLSFQINLLSGLPRELLETVFVHEYTHTWVKENLTPARAKRIGPDAVEGFCELVAYLFAEAQGLDASRTNILGNHYTRGQIQLFVQAEQQFGFNDVVDWMKFGVDGLLKETELGRIREIRMPPQHRAPVSSSFAPVAAAKNFDQMVLQGITWSKTRPMALINGRNFEKDEQAKVPIGSSNVVVRCLEIRPDAVVVQAVGADSQQTLTLAQP